VCLKIRVYTKKLNIKLDHLLLFSLLPSFKKYFDQLINTTSQPVIDKTLNLHDVLNLTGDWNHNFLNENLHVNTANMILAILVHTDMDGPNTIGRGGTTIRHFMVQSAYKLQREHYQHLDGERKTLWSWKCPHGIQTFIWMAIHERLLTNYRRSK
jgi:hypothetical protein